MKQNINLWLRNGKNAKARIILELLDKTKIEAIAYNEIADFCFKEYEKDDTIILNGKINDNIIEIKEINSIKWTAKDCL